MVRPPTPDEIRELQRFMLQSTGDENTAEMVTEDNVAVFPDYQTDGPGYAGPVFMIVWPGSPSFTTTIVRRNGCLECAAETHD